MSYQSPYPNPYSNNQYDGQYQQGSRYAGDSSLDFNPYTQTQQRHPTYDQGGYGASAYDYGGGYKDYPQQQPDAVGNYNDAPAARKETPADQRSGFDNDDFGTVSREKTTDRLRQLDHEVERKAAWTRGGRGSCIGRFCCCTIWITLFLLASIIMSLALWVRPPDIDIGDPQLTGSGIQAEQNNGLKISLQLPIGVKNPNYFAINFKQLKAQLTYPIDDTPIGGGTSNNVNFPSHSQRNFTFPFAIEYKQSDDPSNKVLIDLATKCGVLGTKSDIKINSKITLGIRIAFFTISPSFSQSFSFACPDGADGIAGMLKSATGLGTRDELPEGHV